MYTAHNENFFRRHISDLVFRPVMSKSGALQRHRMARAWPTCKRYTHTNFFFSTHRNIEYTGFDNKEVDVERHRALGDALGTLKNARDTRDTAWE